MLKFLRKHLTGVDGYPTAEPIVTCTTKQLRNAITYALAKVQPARANAEFRQAYAARGASARDDVPGMAWLSVDGRVDQVRLAHHRLTRAARRKREQGDKRTIDQLRGGLWTTSYRPTGPIWRWVVAEQSTCFRPGCDGASTQGDLDHRVAWPFGATDTANLWPGCRTDHRTKHAPGFGIEQAADGSHVLRTAAGFRHPIPPATHPAFDDFSWPEVDAKGFQFGATELRQAIEVFQQWSELSRTRKPEQYWEADFDEGRTEAERDAVHRRRVA